MNLFDFRKSQSAIFWRKSSSKLLLINCDWFANCSLILILTPVRPCWVNARHISLVDTFCICSAKLEKHLPSYKLVVKLLRLDSLKNFLVELGHLADKFRSKSTVLHRLHKLKIFFFFRRSDHRKAIAVFKEVCYQPSDFVFLFNAVWCAFLLLKSIFKILFRSYLIAIWILKLECKVSYDPEESWKVFGNFFRVSFFSDLVLDLKLLTQVDNQRDILKGAFINCAHRVVNKVRT